MTDATPLDGIRVLELGQMIAVPAATHVLAVSTIVVFPPVIMGPSPVM